MKKKTASDEQNLVRFGVSMESPLLEQFDALISQRGYTSRSEAIRDLVRSELVQQSWANDKTQQVAVLGLVYEHHHADLAHRLMHVQHEHVADIVSSLHVHMDNDNCLEIIVFRGQAKQIENVAQRLLSTKGVKFGQLMRATTGKDI